MLAITVPVDMLAIILPTGLLAIILPAADLLAIILLAGLLAIILPNGLLAIILPTAGLLAIILSAGLDNHLTCRFAGGNLSVLRVGLDEGLLEGGHVCLGPVIHLVGVGLVALAVVHGQRTTTHPVAVPLRTVVLPAC